jgi:hypothetical protein
MLAVHGETTRWFSTADPPGAAAVAAAARRSLSAMSRHVRRVFAVLGISIVKCGSTSASREHLSVNWRLLSPRCGQRAAACEKAGQHVGGDVMACSV